MAEAQLSEAAKAELAASQEAKAKSMEAFAEQTKGKPTPTQEENDRAKLGEHIMEHEPDGSNPDPSGQLNKQATAQGGASYSTRSTTAAKPAATTTTTKTV